MVNAEIDNGTVVLRRPHSLICGNYIRNDSGDGIPLAAIRARTDVATAGPWTAEACGCCVYSDDKVAECWHGPNPAADAAFVAHAREDVPALLAEVDRLRAALLEQWRENHFEHCSDKWPHPEGSSCGWPLPVVLGGNPAACRAYNDPDSNEAKAKAEQEERSQAMVDGQRHMFSR